MKHTLVRTDAASCLGALADRLRVLGLAAVGLAAQGGGRGSHEHRTTGQLAAELEEAAEILDAVRAGLCPACALADVSVLIEVGGRG